MSSTADRDADAAKMAHAVDLARGLTSEIGDHEILADLLAASNRSDILWLVASLQEHGAWPTPLAHDAEPAADSRNETEPRSSGSAAPAGRS